MSLKKHGQNCSPCFVCFVVNLQPQIVYCEMFLIIDINSKKINDKRKYIMNFIYKSKLVVCQVFIAKH